MPTPTFLTASLFSTYSPGISNAGTESLFCCSGVPGTKPPSAKAKPLPTDLELLCAWVSCFAPSNILFITLLVISASVAAFIAALLNSCPAPANSLRAFNSWSEALATILPLWIAKALSARAIKS